MEIKDNGHAIHTHRVYKIACVHVYLRRGEEKTKAFFKSIRGREGEGEEESLKFFSPISKRNGTKLYIDIIERNGRMEGIYIYIYSTPRRALQIFERGEPKHGEEA